MGPGIGGPMVRWLLKVGSPDAQFERFGSRFCAEIAITKLWQCDRKPCFDHRLAQIHVPRGAASGDPVILIDIMLLTSQFGATYQLRQFRRRFSPACPALTPTRTYLVKLGGIDSVQADGDPCHVERVAVLCTAGATNVLRGRGKRGQRQCDYKKPFHAKESSAASLPIS